MKLKTEPYLIQLQRWTVNGRHILAQFDADSIVVYQAYRPAIGHFAVKHQRFGGEFSFNRMSWVKTNFLWMMHRSGWATKEGQEVTLAVTIRCEAFNSILTEAVHSTYVPDVYKTAEKWKTRLAASSVRLQWDPDHDPRGKTQERRAIQLGISGDFLKSYASDWILHIEDISAFVAEQRAHAMSGGYERLITPVEQPYPVGDTDLAARLGVSPAE